MTTREPQEPHEPHDQRDSAEFADRIAVVSGGASGIGRAVAEALGARGCRVAVLDIAFDSAAGNAARAASIAVGTATADTAANHAGSQASGAAHGDSRTDASAGASGAAPSGRQRFERVDVSEPAQVEAAIARIEAEWGAIDYGVSVAGILAIGPVVDTDDDTWSRVMSVNASGVFHLHRAIARRMMPRRRGSLVTVSSNAAGIPRHGMAAYAASKAAATMMTKCLGLELAASGIRVNVVSPGSTRTPMQEGMWARGSSEETVLRGSLETYRTGIPLGKLAEPQEVAEAVLFLLSERASHITMADLYVDGGATPR